MSNVERRSLVVAAMMLVAAMLAACASNSAPQDFLPTPEAARISTRGGWVDLKIPGDSTVQRLAGELLAASAESLWVLSPDKGGCVVGRRGIEGNLSRYNPESLSLAGDVLLGTLSTASNGVLLILTAPAWWITGTIGGSYDSHAARVPAAFDSTQSPMDVAAFARFPQGIPRGMDAAYTRLLSGRR